MNLTKLSIGIAGLLILLPTLLPAQDRDVRAERIVVDDAASDGALNTIIIRPPTSLTQNLTLTIPDIGTTSAEFLLMPPGGGGAWLFGGNAGTIAGTNFLGTTDAQPLHLYVNSGTGNSLILDTNGIIRRDNAGDARGNEAVDLQRVRSLSTQVASGLHATISGGRENTASNTYATVGGGRGNIASDMYTTVGGGQLNVASHDRSVVSGGEQNVASGNRSTVGGGSQNVASGDHATVNGGGNDTASNTYTTVSGGQLNVASGLYATIGGGLQNIASENRTTVSGGEQNAALGNRSTVGGGSQNVASGDHATVSGGGNDTASNTYTTVSGGQLNVASGNRTTVSGGSQNVASGDHATVSGGGNDTASNTYTTVSGGLQNKASGIYATVSGGTVNTASNSYSTVSGGTTNTASGLYATVSGGWQNTASGDRAKVGGGWENTASGDRSTVSGGWQNTASGSYATIGGGQQNAASGDRATVSGGFQDTASGVYAAIGGGQSNTASGSRAAVGGGNLNAALGDYSAIPGGRGLTLDAAADRSFGFLSNNGGTNVMTITAPDVAVFGNANLWLANNTNAASQLRFYEANATTGAFPGTTNFSSFQAQTQTANISYLLPATVPGTLPTNDLVLAITGITGTQITLSWVDNTTLASDRGKKEHFQQLSGEDILAKFRGLELGAWNYRGERARHYGIMAQDFYRTFGGEDEYGVIGTDTTVNVLDLHGVSFLAIQGLEKRTSANAERTSTNEVEIENLKEENVELRSRLARLEEELKEIRAALQTRREDSAE